MVRLEKSKALGRLIRQDDAAELGISTWKLVREAIQAGKVDEALKYLNYGCSEVKMLHDSMISFVDDAFTHLAGFGEEEIYEVVKKRYYPVVRRWLSETPGLEESLQRAVEFQRGHGGSLTVTEEADRYVVRCDPCGSGGQLRRTKDVGTLGKTYPWAWGKSGIPYYCAHCAVLWEILPIELRGYPIRISELGDKPEDPCIHYYYKKPELIPEEYFIRVGMAKTIK